MLQIQQIPPANYANGFYAKGLYENIIYGNDLVALLRVITSLENTKNYKNYIHKLHDFK